MPADGWVQLVTCTVRHCSWPYTQHPYDLSDLPNIECLLFQDPWQLFSASKKRRVTDASSVSVGVAFVDVLPSVAQILSKLATYNR